MPCRDYESDSWGSGRREGQLKEQADRLARIACKAMDALEAMGKEDFLLLKDAEVREWWAAHKEADRKEQARVAEQQRQEAVKQEALNKLSDEEKELLGLKPKNKKHVKRQSPTPVRWDVEVTEELAELFEETVKKINGGQL